MLAALGAEVFKVDSPDGDLQLVVRPNQRGMGVLIIFNLGKKGVVLTKTEQGLNDARALVATSDVFVNNMRAGAPAKLGLGYEEVRELNPRIVYCASTGWGTAGRWWTWSAICRSRCCGTASLNGQPGGRWS